MSIPTSNNPVNYQLDHNEFPLDDFGLAKRFHSHFSSKIVPVGHKSWCVYDDSAGKWIPSKSDRDWETRYDRVGS